MEITFLTNKDKSVFDQQIATLSADVDTLKQGGTGGTGNGASIVIDNTLTIEGAAADAKAVGDALVAQPQLTLNQLTSFSEEEQEILLEASSLILLDEIQSIFDNLQSSSATLTINGVNYTVRGLGEVKDSIMFKEGALRLCHKIADAGDTLLTECTFETINYSNLSQVINGILLPCQPKALLNGALSYISYADCGAYLDGIHDDYEAMYRAHYIGNLTHCNVEQHGGTIYKANSGWLFIKDHNVNLSGSVLLINEYNRYGYYWLNDTSVWDMTDEQLVLFREQMKEYSTEWPVAEYAFRANGLFIATYPEATKRWNAGTLTLEDRIDVVRHGSDGKVYNSVIDDAPANAEVKFHLYPETQLTFTGCTLKIDIAFSTVAMYFMRCHRSNCIIRDFIIDPSRRTTDNTGYRGHVFDIQKCADVTLENIKGINIAGKPNDTYPRGISGYILHAQGALNVMVRDCNMLGYWGCTGLQGVKDVTFENCELNRVDVHDYFRNLIINNCRLYGQLIQVGYGKGAVNISNSSFLTDWVHQMITLRCDYGRYFEGEINISNVDAVYTGEYSFDIVSGSSMFSEESATNTELYIKHYPTINIVNLTLRTLNDSYAGYIFNLPSNIEELIEVQDTKKLIKYANLVSYNTNNDYIKMDFCSIDGAISSDDADILNELNDISIRLAALEQNSGNSGSTAIDYLYYSRRNLAFNGANANIRLRLPVEETPAIYHVKCKLLTGADVSVTVTDWTLSTEIFDGDEIYIRLPTGAMNNSKEIIFAAYPGTVNSGTYEITVERTAETDAYTGEIQLDFAAS